MGYSKLIHVLFAISNLILQLNGQESAVGNQLPAILRKEYKLECRIPDPKYSAESIEWYKDDKSIKDEKRGHYSVDIVNDKSILKIKSFVKEDANITRWQAIVNSNGQKTELCAFSKIYIKPTPQGMRTDRSSEVLDSEKNSIRVSERESIKLTCIIEASPSDLKQVTWGFGINSEVFDQLPNGVITDGNELRIENIEKIHRGYYRCTFNEESYTALMRVKDRLAPLWPFIGIVTTVIVLVILIFIFEKQQKARKKAAATDVDDQDQANDPLVRTPTKTSDSDAKKREVKA